MEHFKSMAATAALLAACGSKSFDPENQVQSVRILATQADLPYSRPGDTVKLQILAVDARPTRPEPMQVFWFPDRCVDPAGDGYFNCYPALLQNYPLHTDLSPRLNAGSTASFQMPADVIAQHQGPRGDVPYGVMVVFAMA